MTLFQDPDAVPRTAAERLGDVLDAFAAVGDRAARNAPGLSRRKAAAAAAIARAAGRSEDEVAALYFAGLLHAIGAIGNEGLRRNHELSDRIAEMARWDVPAEGARLCETIAALPKDTADFVRWQSEAWDGTGFPDQLRWQGIPACAQLLHLADIYARAEDVEETLSAVAATGGRIIGPEFVGIYVRWFHMSGGELDDIAPPLSALNVAATDPEQLVDLLADRIDAHNDTPGRRARVTQFADALADIMKIGSTDRLALALAVRTFGAGELDNEPSEDERFDPLARLGIAERAGHAAEAADIFAGNVTFAGAAETLRNRSAWYDGSGIPALESKAIPIAARILSAVLARDALEQAHRTQIREDRTAPADRIDTAAGSQFDPAVARAMLEAARATA